MKKRIWSILASMLMFSMTLPALAAPLFPDVPENHWAKDAVAALAAKGLVEGYPDGTFKGDRAATRWETAMIVARLLAKMEQAHATFATKAELDELRKLVNALREELDALGVRVTNLEENVARIDKRVTELERITFYGEIDARATFQSFNNDGRRDNDGLRLGGGNLGIPGPLGSAVGNPLGNPQLLNYDALVGTAAGAALSPANNGVWPVMDYRNGRALTNGTGFTTRAMLGLRIRVSDDIDAGAEFSAYTSQGDQLVDAYWGVQAPYLSNQFTANTAQGNGFIQPLNNVPFTRMNLDNFWVIHNPSKTKLVVGAYGEDKVDNIIYAGQYNPNAFGPRFNQSYGWDLTGMWDVSDWGVLHWEVMGTKLADGVGVGYEPWLFGGDVALEFEGGFVKANYARVIQDSNNSGALTAGNIAATNSLGFVNGFSGFGGFAPLQWVNPPGFYAAQQSQFQQNFGGAGTTVDTRPLAGANTANDAFVGGSFGPQSQDMWGLSAAYAWGFGDGDQVRLDGEWGHSVYRPNRNSGFDVDGDAFRVGVGVNLLDGDLDLAGEYVSVDATYDPFILSYPAGTVGVMRMPNIHYFSGLYSLHDTEKYPHNREGFRLKGTWKFNERRGAVWGKLGFLDQKSSSLYNVRVTPGALGGATPTAAVIGHAPGFIDPVFAGFAHPAVYGAGSANSFTANLAPLENPSGSHNNYALGVTYKFDDPRIKVDFGYERHEYERNSGLAPAFGGSQNNIDLDITQIHGELGWEANDKWTVRGGADWVNINGHYDPAGVYNNFAIQTNSTTFDTVDNDQIIPFIGFDYDVSENTTWNMDLRYYNTDSNVNNGTTNVTDAVGNTQNPFDFSGLQVTTQFKLKF
jgi:hypothetical protein